MKPTPKLLNYAKQFAVRTARLYQLDPDVTLSTAYALAVEKAAGATTELDSIRLFAFAARRGLVSAVVDDCCVFGPTLATRRQRRYTKKQGKEYTRVTEEVLTKVQYNDTLPLIDFLDQFSGRSLQFVLLIIAGYTQTELIQQFGFTRTEINDLKERLQRVYKIR